MLNTDIVLNGPIFLNRNAIFDKIIELMIEAGWENISSNEATDWFVMRSKNALNDEDLLIQLTPLGNTYTNGPLNQDQRKTKYGNINGRCLLDYTPGENGASGVFNQTGIENRVQNTAFHQFTLTRVNDQIEMTDHELSYYIDKQRCIFMTKGPKYNSNHYLTAIFGFGLPVEHFYKDIYPKRDSVLWSLTDAFTYILDHPKEFGYSLNEYSLYLRTENSFKNPDWLQRINLSELKYGTNLSPYCNYRGKLWGVWMINNVQVGTISNEDIIVDSSNRKFQVNNFVHGSEVFAVRIE